MAISTEDQATIRRMAREEAARLAGIKLDDHGRTIGQAYNDQFTTRQTGTPTVTNQWGN